ncbi:hypothetical protein [Streptomyces hirsutus]|uniref:hypothetical protein n=1 Tax=Streptomyces hirsutus TaxID=35620 RepID=UPI0006E209D7|nr:hypothetical protein [Streptomyces hirsutus]
MPFPPGDMVAAFGIHLHFQALEQALCERHPELAERVRFDDSQGRMLLKVFLSGAQAVGLAHVRMGHSIVWAVMDPVLRSEPYLWPLNTPDEVLVDALHAHASAHLTGEPLSSPWRWNESEPSEITELADLLEVRGVRVRRVAAGNGYFAYRSRNAPKLYIVDGREGALLEAEFPEALVRVSLKPTLGWLVDVHTPRWGGWGRVELDWCLRSASSPTPGVPRANVSVEELAELLCKGPEAWETEPPWAPPQFAAPTSQKPGSAQQESLFADQPMQNDFFGRSEEFSDLLGELEEESVPERRPGPLTPREITEAVLQQLTTLGFSDLLEGEADSPIESDAFHIEWRSTGKDLSTTEMQRLNGLAAAAGEDVPKRLIVITDAGLTRPAAEFADKAKAYAFHLDRTTCLLIALNSRAREAMPPTKAPGVRGLEPW